MSLTFDELIDLERHAGQAFGPYHREWLLRRAPEKVRRLLELGGLHPEIVGGGTTFVGMPAQLFPGASLKAAINTTVTETNLWDPGLFAPIAALTMKAGQVYEVEFGGVMGTTATPTIVWTARYGTNNSAPPTGTTFGASPTVTLGTFTAQPFYGKFVMGCRLVGVAASGATVTGNGFVCMPAAAAATVVPQTPFGGAILTTADHTIAQGIGVSIIWGASSASNTLTPQWMTFKSFTN